MNDIPPHIEQQVRDQILQDLDPPTLLVHTKVAVATLVGGFLSLAVCGQFGIGLTSFAEVFTDKMHDSMDPFMCALACGGLYAVFPVAVLRFLLAHPLQFKAIMQRRKMIVSLWFVGFGGTVAYFGHHGNTLLNFSAWIVAALVTAHVLTFVYSKILPAWNPTALFTDAKIKL